MDTLVEQVMGSMPVTIDYLPPALRQVPPLPGGRNDPQRVVKQARFDHWRSRILVERARIAHIVTAQDANAEVVQAIKTACANDWAYFIAMFCWVYEPRKTERGGGWTEFVPFPVQIHLIRRIQWMLTQSGRQADLIVSKSRDVGATWIVAMCALAGFLLDDPFVVKVVSRKESEVDARYQPDAVMTRIYENLKRLKETAPFLLPPGFDPDAHRRELLIFRPDILNNIHGESTAPGSTGRGGRATLAIIDEAAFVKGLGEIWATLANTTDHRIAVSSESLDFGEDFYRMRVDEGGPPVLAVEWWQHPWHDDEWHANMRLRYGNDEARFMREVERDPLAGSTDFVYPQARDIATVHRTYKPESRWPIYVGIDPGLDDETCLHWLTQNPLDGRYALIRTYTNAHLPPEFYAALILGVHDPDFDPWLKLDELDLIDWVRTLPRPAFIFGDPAGKSKQQDDDDKKTWYGRMETYSVTRGHDLRAPTKTVPGYDVPPPKKWTLAVTTRTKKAARFIPARRQALMTLFKALDFYDHPSVERTLVALKELKFEQHGGTKPPQAERTSYAHTWRSHRAAALEYVAVNLEEIIAYRPKKPRDESSSMDKKRLTSWTW